MSTGPSLKSTLLAPLAIPGSSFESKFLASLSKASKNSSIDLAEDVDGGSSRTTSPLVFKVLDTALDLLKNSICEEVDKESQEQEPEPNKESASSVVSKLSIILKYTDFIDPERVKYQITNQTYFECETVFEFIEKILFKSKFTDIHMALTCYVTLLILTAAEGDLEKYYLAIGRCLTKIPMESGLVPKLFTDFYNQSWQWIERCRSCGGQSQPKMQGSILLTTLDTKLLTLILTPNTYLVPEILSQIEFRGFKYHKNLIPKLLDFAAEIHYALPLTDQQESLNLNLVCLNIKTYLKCLINYHKAYLEELLSLISTNFSLYLGLIMPVLPRLGKEFIEILTSILQKCRKIIQTVVDKSKGQIPTENYIRHLNNTCAIANSICQNNEFTGTEVEAQMAKSIQTLSGVILKKKATHSLDTKFLINFTRLSLLISGVDPRSLCPKKDLLMPLSFKTIYVSQRLYDLMKEEDDLSEFKLLQTINFSYVILTTKTDITKKMLKGYTTEITPKYIQGFTKVKSPILYSEFLGKVLKLHNCSTLKDFSVLVPKKKFYKDLVNQITETGSIIHPKTGLVQISNLVAKIGGFIRKIYVQDKSKYALIAQNYANLSSSLRDLNSDDGQAIEESSSQICKQIEDMDAKEISTYLSKKLSQIL